MFVFGMCLVLLIIVSVFGLILGFVEDCRELIVASFVSIIVCSSGSYKAFTYEETPEVKPEKFMGFIVKKKDVETRLIELTEVVSKLKTELEHEKNKEKYETLCEEYGNFLNQNWIYYRSGENKPNRCVKKSWLSDSDRHSFAIHLSEMERELKIMRKVKKLPEVK